MEVREGRGRAAGWGCCQGSTRRIRCLFSPPQQAAVVPRPDCRWPLCANNSPKTQLQNVVMLARSLDTFAPVLPNLTSFSTTAAGQERHKFKCISHCLKARFLLVAGENVSGTPSSGRRAQSGS